MSVKVQSEADKKEGSVIREKEQSTLYNLNYPDLHWDTIYVDTKFYIAHPLDLDKLLKLESEIKNEKIKLNLNQHSQHNPENNNRQDRTEISQIDNHRPVSALSRQCKTEINQVVQIKTKLKVQNQLIGEQERYQMRATEINKKKQEFKQTQEAGKPSSAKSLNSKQINQSKGAPKQGQKDTVLKQSSKGEKRIQTEKEKSIKGKEENPMGIQKQVTQKSKSEIKKSEQNQSKLEKNYISFHPNNSLKSPRFDIDNKSGKANFEDTQKPRQPKFDGRQSLTNSSKAINKSFVVNLRKSTSNSKQQKQMKQLRPTSGRKIKSASSTHSKVYLQQLNKKIKDMQEHLENIQRRQKQFEEIEKSRVVGRESGLNNNKQSSKSMKISEKMGEKKYSKESSEAEQLFPADYNLKMKKNNSRYELQTQQERLKEIEKEKQRQSLRNQTIKSSIKSNKIQKFSNMSYENMNSNKSSAGDKEEKINKQSHVFDLTIYRTKRLNFASSIVQYDHSEDLKKIRKDIAEQEQKQKMMEQIADLKKMIRELKLQKIKQQSIIQQLEKKEKQKESLKSLLNSKLDQGDPQQKLKVQSVKKDKTILEQQIGTKKNDIVPSPKQNRSRLQYKNEEKIEVVSPIYTKKQAESTLRKDENRPKIPPTEPIEKERKRKRTEIEENQFTPKKTETQMIIQRQSSQSKQFTRFPKEESTSKKQIFKKQKIKPLNIETINSKGSQNLPSIHKNVPGHSSINPEEGSYRQFHPYSLKKKGIVVRQILDEQTGDPSQKSSSKQINVERKDNSYDNQSPLSTGRKIFELQFVKEIKKKKQPEIVEQQPDLTAPEIKVSVFPIPKLPPTPSPDINQSDLLSLAKEICSSFNIKVQSDEHIYMKKYKNCIIFKTPDIKKTVVWHYSGKFYVGGWDQNEQGEGKKHGEGFQFLPEKHYYKGQFLDGKKNGSGTMIFVNGNVYKGQWMKGLKHGLGVFYQQQTGLLYEGEWKEDKKYGKGVLKVSDQQFYDGTFVKSIKHGYGLELFSNGDYYKGQYKMGRFHGKGRYVWKNGASYDGSFVQGRREGIGRWKSSKTDYDIYFGEYKSDKKSGKGEYTWNNGTIYEGNFVNDLKHGEGRVEYPDGRQIKGYWQNGKLVEVDQNIEQIQKESSKNQYLYHQESQKFKELHSKQLQPSHRLTKI